MEASRRNHRPVKLRHPLHPVAVRALKLNNPWVLFVIIVRIFSAFTILVHPWWGMLIYWICDSKDNYILRRFASYTNGMYHQLDKPLDWVGLVCMYIVGYRQGLGMILGILLLYRLIGYVLYLITQKRWTFVIFPNIFEMVFVWFIVLPSAGIPVSWIYTHTRIGLFFLCIMRIAIELHLHVYQPSRYLRIYERQKK